MKLKIFVYSFIGIFVICTVMIIGVIYIHARNRPLFERITHIDYRNVFTYGQLNTTGKLTIDNSKGIVYFNDNGVSSSGCDLSSKDYCINVPGFSFSVPYILNTKTQSWDNAGYHYEVKHDAAIPAVFHNISDLVIITQVNAETTSADKGVIFYYSPSWGMLGFEVRGKDGLLVSRWTQSCMGFGGKKSGSLMDYLFQKCWNSS